MSLIGDEDSFSSALDHPIQSSKLEDSDFYTFIPREPVEEELEAAISMFLEDQQNIKDDDVFALLDN